MRSILKPLNVSHHTHTNKVIWMREINGLNSCNNNSNKHTYEPFGSLRSSGVPFETSGTSTDYNRISFWFNSVQLRKGSCSSLSFHHWGRSNCDRIGPFGPQHTNLRVSDKVGWTVIVIGTMLLFHVDTKPPQRLLLWSRWHQHGSQIFKCV